MLQVIGRILIILGSWGRNSTGGCEDWEAGGFRGVSLLNDQRYLRCDTFNVYSLVSVLSASVRNLYNANLVFKKCKINIA